MDLYQTRAIQNSIFEQDVREDLIRQNFMYFLGNHPYLFQEFTDSGLLTNAEMNYIVEHFHDYDVDPRTFENDFKREMREALPRYNNMKGIELLDDVFELVDDKYTRGIVRQRVTDLSENTTNNGTSSTTSNDDTKSANRELPMETSGTSTIDGIVSWGDGASNINENKSTGSSSITSQDARILSSLGHDNGNSTETYEHHGNPVEHIDKIWQYLLKPKAIQYLTAAISSAFILVY